MNCRIALKKICQILLATLFIPLIGCTSKVKAPQPFGLPIVQGLTNQTATQIAIVSPSDLALAFFYSDGTSFVPVPSTFVTSNAKLASDFVVHHLQLQGLKLNIDYTLEVREVSGRLIDRRRFRALDTRQRPAKVIAASCLYDLFLNESRGMWKAVLGAKPDLLLLIGDNVYAEISNGRFPSPLGEAALWTRYTETFLQLDLYRASDLVPTLVTWDDHDYGMKDGNRENPHKIESKKVLEAFFAQSPSIAFPEFETGPGVSSMFDAFGYRFMLLDSRSFRTPAGTAVTNETHFGEAQEKWIFQNVHASSTPVWLISGDQWFGAYHRFESYERQHPESFKRFFSRLRNSKATVMFMSGDRHLSEISRIEPSFLGYETYEVTSSALHSKTYPANWNTMPNMRQVRGIDMQHAFTLFELTPSLPDQSVRLKGETRGQESKVLYSFDFKIARHPVKKPRR